MISKALLTLGVTAALSLPVGAHHSYSAFAVDRTVALQGKIERIVFGNPHVVLDLRTASGDVYEVVWRASGQLERNGVSRDALAVGDDVVIKGSPALDAARHELTLIKEVHRPRDGWTWQLDSQRVSRGNESR